MKKVYNIRYFSESSGWLLLFTANLLMLITKVLINLIKITRYGKYTYITLADLHFLIFLVEPKSTYVLYF